MLWWWFGGGFDHQVDREMSDITNKVAGDAVTEYKIAYQQGDPMQMCVQAGSAAAAFLQAHDTTNYNAWKAREASDCRRAGAPW